MEPIGTATSDGGWTTNEYSGSNLNAVYSGFGDQTPTTDDNLTRKTVFGYDANGFYSSISEYALGTLLRTTSFGEAPNQRTETVSGLGASPMATVTTQVAAGDFAGEIESIARPDGTMSLFEYGRDAVTGWRTNTTYYGEPNGNGDAIVAGTKTVAVLDQVGVVQSWKSYDLASGILTANQSFTNFDDYGRYQQMIDHLGDYTNFVTYICCGIESFTGKDGLTTTYGWDDLKRVTSITRQGITQIRGFDAANRQLQTTRQGTDGSQILQNTSGFDVLGRLTASTNAVGDFITYAYGFDANGRPQTTITHPDLSTRISTSHLDGSLQSVTGTAVHGVRHEYGVNGTGTWTKEIKLLANGNDSQEWVQSYADGLGRSIKTVYPDAAESTQHYNASGQLWKSVDPDGVTSLYQYNGQGQLEYSAIDMNGNDVIDFAGTDRITQSVRSVGAATAFAGDAHISERRVWNEDGVNGSVVVGRSEAAVNGSHSARIAHGLATVSETACGANCTATTTHPDGSYVTTVKTNGFVAEVTRYDSQAVQLSSVDYGYDTHGRRKYVIDARNGTTSHIFDDTDRVTAVTTPSPGMGQPPQTVSTFFNNMGRAWRVVQPDGASVTNEYHLTGELKKTSGARTYPVEYSHDYAGRMKTMTTWQDHATDSGKAVTTWNHHPQRGWLDSKQYDDGNGPSYTYHPSGKLHTRTWVRGTAATYLYNSAGQLASVDYSDATPDIGYTYNRRGQQDQITQGAITTARTYTPAGKLETESYTGGPLNGLTVTNSFDSLQRRSRLQLLGTPNVQPESVFGYDDASRLSTVSDGTHTGTYSYLANSPLVEQIAFDQSGTTRMISTKAHDFANRLTSIGHADGQAATLASRAYGYNAANQRTNVVHEDNSYWSFGYDNLGQVNSGKKRNGANQLYPGLQYEFDHDDIGNRTETRTGGDANGGSLRMAKYTPNKLNQYQQREVPGFIEVQGTAAANATVTVNGQATERLGSFYRKELFADNVGGPLAVGITNTAVIPGGGPGGEDLVKEETGTRLHSSTPEVFSHDADGNLLADSRWNYTWNGENRLIEQTSSTNLPAAKRRKLVFTYDPQGRRISKSVLVWDSVTSTYLPLSDVAFVYDGWNLIAEIESGNVKNSYTWGLDLSGTEQGAGGVGGLLFFSQVSGAQPSTHFVGHDGNGNVILLTDAASGIATGDYEYSPFGKVVRATGSMALVNPFRFSTKYQDDETGFNYYGHRFYNPDSGRWLNRDPIGEAGGLNLQAFVRNSTIDLFDPLGLSEL
ncbi:MAG: RHS repeat-associated core domain-containing protein, partial [Limisphaerales bacterium]